jgi:tetratricopeptide (TPR) repeat protein
MSAPQTLAEEYFTKASALDVDESRHNAAATWYRKALEIDPYLVPALINLANIHYGKDELAEAQALYERAIGLDPGLFSRRTSTSATSITTLADSKRLRAAIRTALRLQQPICRRALLPGDYPRKDRALTRGQAALARVSDALAGRRMGGAGEGILRIEHWKNGRLLDCRESCRIEEW